jgi:hypothetical protein
MKGLHVRDIQVKIIRYKAWIAVFSVISVLLGIILPNSFSDHYKLLHFSAHFGMSFLIANSFYKLLSIKMQHKFRSFLVVFLSILIVGSVYKLFEIHSFFADTSLTFSRILLMTGFYTSMSQNLGGMFASFVLVLYFERFIPNRQKLRQAEHVYALNKLP